MARTWTVASATSYVEMYATSKSRGLKYCSAVDFLRSHGVSVEAKPTPQPNYKKKKKRKTA